MYISYIRSMDGFAAHVRRRYASGTARHYQHDVEEYRKVCGEDLDNTSLKRWRSQLTGRPATKNRKIAAVRSWALYRGICVTILNFKAHAAVRMPVDSSAIDRVAGDEGLLLRLLAATGMRVAEALSLRASAISGGYIRVMGKGSKERQLPVPSSLQRELLALGREALFPYSYSWAHRAASMAGVKPHDLRHECATSLLNAGVNIIAIRDILGHTSTKTTSIYARPSMATLIKNRNLLNR